MALNNIQQRIERSIYERIRLILVREGLWPDESAVDYSNNKTLWDTAIRNIVQAKAFAVEPFGHGSSQDKGERRTPRIVIIPRRFTPGDIGNPVNPVVVQSETDITQFDQVILPQQTVEFHLDIHLVSSTASQDRTLNAIMYEALGSRRFIPFYDDSTKNFFLKQYNYYDLPDPSVGVEEKVYSYQVDDLYITPPEVVMANVPTIAEITAEIQIVYSPGVKVENDGSIVIDLSHIQYL